jgi:NtrC-family two-component system response regulator AlgB
LAFFAKSARRQPLRFAESAEQALLAYPWPGNIRELRNTIERAVILWPAQIVEPEAFPTHIAGRHPATAPQLGGHFTLDAIEREHIKRVLAETPTQEDAAAILGIDVSTLWRKRKKYES